MNPNNSQHLMYQTSPSSFRFLYPIVERSPSVHEKYFTQSPDIRKVINYQPIRYCIRNP